jgi:hypothetical protein
MPPWQRTLSTPVDFTRIVTAKTPRQTTLQKS